ncbi:MAG TPA: FG-GAP-like repeat-containing protein [Candidatus Acidoferrales bacterium]|nr:FG-GAP-like repeat-containing protein [Candidatus Acidoferrales bacterium]
MRFPFQRAAALLLFPALAIPCAAPAQDPATAGEQASPSQPATLGLDTHLARRSLEAGKRAEAAGHFEEALAAYDEASRLDRRNRAALERGALQRSRLVHQRAEDAERLALAGEAAQAVTELRAALRLDPGNTSVAERLRQVSAMVRPPPQVRSEPATESANLPRLQPQVGKRSFDMRGDVRAIYEKVAQSFGLKVIFDPDLPPRNVQLRTGELDFATTMTVLTAQTATFLRAVDSSTFLVAADTPAKRTEYRQVVEETIDLPDAVGPEEMTELLRVLREITLSNHVHMDTRSRTISIRDTPGNVALARELIQQIEQTRGELMLEFELLEVNRTAAENLGIAPPTSLRALTLSTQDVRSLQQAKDLQTLIGILQRILGAQGLSGLSTGGAGVAVLPPVVAIGGGKTTVFSPLPGAAAQFSEVLSLVKSGRRALLRAQDGKPASLFVGDRVPITLSLLSASLGTINFTPTVSPSLLPRSDFPTGKAPVAAAVADFTGDGLRDIAVANTNDSSISILLNQGKGNFIPAPGSPIVPGSDQTAPISIATGDLNRDGIVDLLVVNQGSNNVTLLLGKGDGTFTAAPASPVATGNRPSGIVVADFNGDNNLDFAVTNFDDNTVSIFLSDGSGGFTQAPGSPLLLGGGAQGPVAIALADFNNDGKQDLAVVNRTTNNVSILLGKGDGTFTEATGSPIPVGNTPVALAAGDLNGDARPDLAVVNQAGNSMTILLNNGDATFSAATNSPLSTGSTPSGVAIADFNNDNRNDIIVTNQGEATISIYLGLGAGVFLPRFSLPTAEGPSAVVAADLNGNGLPDAAIAEATANEVSIIFNPVNFAGGAGGGALQQPFPASEYVDLGFKIKATPTLHPNGEVTLQLEFEIRALSGQSVNGIPILSNRTISQTIRVREGETTLIGGMLDTEETRSLSGLPGFANLPGAGYLGGARNKQASETQLLILVTPRQLRLRRRISRPIYAGTEKTGAQPAAPVL